MGALISAEQFISQPIAMIPFPGFPALRVFDMDVGLPHAHNHPPNLIPPAPPVPLPSVGPVIPIPILSGASRVQTNNMAAARCGDMGLGVWCGGFFPMFEVFLGSASVWIESARAARAVVDVTKHCIFSAPKPSDPPMGPMFGTTLSGSGNTLIGGVPMPSLTSLAIAAAFKALFKGLGKLFRGSNRGIAQAAAHGGGGAGRGAKFRAFLRETGEFLRSPRQWMQARRARASAVQQYVNRVLGPNGSIRGSLAFREAVVADLQRIEQTAVGQSTLSQLRNAGHPITIRSPSSGLGAAWNHSNYGAHCRPLGSGGHVGLNHAVPGGANNGVARLPKHQVGPFRWGYHDVPVSPGARGSGVGSEIVYHPNNFPNARNPGSPSDVVLLHEMNHAANNSAGAGQGAIKSQNPAWNQQWTNFEEHQTVGVENTYRTERNAASGAADQVPNRPDYSVLP